MSAIMTRYEFIPTKACTVVFESSSESRKTSKMIHKTCEASKANKMTFELSVNGRKA